MEIQMDNYFTNDGTGDDNDYDEKDFNHDDE